MTKEVEILKIGQIMPVIPIKGSNMYDTSQFSKPTIMVVCDGGTIFDYYVSMLKKNCDEYKFLNTAQSIVGKITTFKSSLISNQAADNTGTLKGIPDEYPIVGKPYTINNSSWHTSRVQRIIDDCIIITKNSVYAIHDVSLMRDKQLNKILK